MKTHKNTNIFEWLELFTEAVKRNAGKEQLPIDDESPDTLQARFGEISEKLMAEIRHQLFSVTKSGKKRVLVRDIHSKLVALLNQFEENSPEENNLPITLTRKTLQNAINFLAQRYSVYLSPNEQMPRFMLNSRKGILKHRLNILTQRLTAKDFKNPTLHLAFNKLFRFINSTASRYPATYRELTYYETLLKELEGLRFLQYHDQPFSTLDQLLIYLNFNSKDYLRILINGIQMKSEGKNTPEEKITELQHCLKILKQIKPKPKTIFNPHYYDLSKLLGSWIQEELNFLSNSSEENLSSKKDNTTKRRILCHLSSDQIALILRAADESRLLEAKSMTEVFKTIVPHLSTPNKPELSYNAVRNKTYQAEERDKNIAIERLERMIGKIREY